MQAQQHRPRHPDVVREVLDLGGSPLAVRRLAPGPQGAVGERAVLIHGLGQSSSDWAPVMPLLAGRLDPWAPDLPGHGASPPASDHSPEAHADAVIRLIDHGGGAGGPVHLAGNSLGGLVALLVAVRRPDLVRTLTLVSPALPARVPTRAGLGMLAASAPVVGERLVERAGRRTPEQRARDLLRLVYAAADDATEEDLAALAEEIGGRGEHPHLGAAYLASLRGLVRWHLRTPGRAWEFAAAVQAPTTVLYGGHDRLVSARAAARARRMFRGADVVVDPGAGHIPQREDPAGTAAVLLRRAGSPSPVTAPTAGRATTRVRVVVVGSGFSGLAAAVRLRRAGHHDLLVLERGDEVGGTWRDNTYPGCACDIPSHLYSLSFAPNPGWSRRFSGQAEILRYLQRVADDFGVTPRIRLRTRMTSARWDPGLRRWVLETSTGRVEAEVLVLATGPLAEPSVPDVPGATEFEGRMFHSARWDHDLDLTGRRVVVVGTGASAVQFVPRIAPQVAALTVLQRTAPWVQPRGDREVPHWQRALHRAVPPTQTLARAGVYASREAVAGAMLGNRALQRFAEAACLRHLRSQVADPVLRARLTPSYRIGCKRVLLSDDWYPALTLPHVEVVDSALKRLRPDGVVTASGRFVPADTVVFGTGFSVTDSPTAGLVRGTDGRSLAEVWDGHPQAYLGTAYPGFPNLFHLGGPNTGLGHNSVVVMFEAQLDYVLTALRALDGRPDASIEPTAAALQRYDDELRRRMRRTVWATGGCASWYMDARGEVAALWPDRVGRFRRRMREFVPQDHVVTVPTGVRP